MLVRLLTTMAGPEGLQQSGTVLDVPETIARQLMEGGHAIQVGGHTPPRLELAEAQPVETAVKRRRRK